MLRFLVPACNFYLTSEHSLQISTTRIFGVTKDDCINMLATSDSDVDYAIYCQNEAFCGRELMPNKTTEMSVSEEKNCWAFAREIEQCDDLEGQLLISGNPNNRPGLPHQRYLATL